MHNIKIMYNNFVDPSRPTDLDGSVGPSMYVCIGMCMCMYVGLCMSDVAVMHIYIPHIMCT